MLNHRHPRPMTSARRAASAECGVGEGGPPKAKRSSYVESSATGVCQPGLVAAIGHRLPRITSPDTQSAQEECISASLGEISKWF